MVSKLRKTLSAPGPVVWDSEALSRAVRKDVHLRRVLIEAKRGRLPVVVSAATLVEVVYIVAATALRLGPTPLIFTSDPDDIKRLVDKKAAVIHLR